MGALPVGLPSLSTGVSNNAMNSDSLEQLFILVSIVAVAVLTSALRSAPASPCFAVCTFLFIISDLRTLSSPLPSGVALPGAPLLG